MQITTIGLDLANRVFQVHGIDATGQVVVRKSLRRSQILPFLAKLPSCLVGIVACGTSHHWARESQRCQTRTSGGSPIRSPRQPERAAPLRLSGR
jgi:hypothetical protein